jgi:hypothetical protein
MPDPLLLPSELKKSAQEMLSQPELFDSELDYFELGESYFLRRFKRALELTGSRVMPPIISLIAATLIGVYQGQAFATIWAGVISGLIVLVVGLILILTFNYLFSAPKKLDDTLRENLRAAKAQLEEERRKAARAIALVEGHYKTAFDQLQRIGVTFEVSTAIRESTVLLTDPGDTEDWRDATAFCLQAKLFVRYWNDNPDPVRIHGFRFSIVNNVAGTEVELTSLLMPPVFRPPGATENHYFLGFMLAANDLTEHYYHQFSFNVPTDCALSTDKDSYLRVTMNAGKQNPFSVDLDVKWRQEKECFATVSIRKPAAKLKE